MYPETPTCWPASTDPHTRNGLSSRSNGRSKARAMRRANSVFQLYIFQLKGNRRDSVAGGGISWEQWKGRSRNEKRFAFSRNGFPVPSTSCVQSPPTLEFACPSGALGALGRS